MRVASKEDTLRGKIQVWGDPRRRLSKRMKDLADIARLVEAHPDLWVLLGEELQKQVPRPQG